MSAQAVVAIVLFVVAQICILAAALTNYAMIARINARASEEDRVSYLFSNNLKWGILARYRKLYPGGGLYRRYMILLFSGFGIGLLAIVTWISAWPH